MPLTVAPALSAVSHTVALLHDHRRASGLPDLLRHARNAHRVQPTAARAVLQEAVHVAQDHVRALHHAPVQVSTRSTHHHLISPTVPFARYSAHILSL